MSKEGEGLVELEQVLFRGEAGARAARILHATTNTPTAKHFSPVNFTILSSDPKLYWSTPHCVILQLPPTYLGCTLFHKSNSLKLFCTIASCCPKTAAWNNSVGGVGWNWGW